MTQKIRKNFFFLVLVLVACVCLAQKNVRAAASEKPASLKTIYFDVNNTVIKDSDSLKRNAAWIKANRDKVILIEGHCDERGSDDFNLHLGDRRARSVMAALMKEGVPENQMVLVSFGKKKPVVKKPSEEGWSQNRRVEFRVR